MVNKKNNMIKIKYSFREKILKFLLENKQKWSILEIANNLNADYKNTFQAIDKLYPDLIYKEKKGSMNLIEIKSTPNTIIYSVEEKRKKEFLEENKKLKLIKEDIEKINYPFFIVLLFGSVAKKTATEKSDIDICIISDNKEKTNELISKLKILPYPIEIQDFKISEFESMLNKKEGNVAKEIIKNNIILYGIENYYNLISRWMKNE
jgi:predicted nucleotidyltransferase